MLGIIILIIGVLLFLSVAKKQKANPLSTSILLSGMVSNLIDRLYYKGVVDYIGIGQIPTFNVADIVIISGLALFALHMLKSEIQKSP
jgi:signal peptidase II